MRQARFGPKNIVTVARPQRNISSPSHHIMIASALYASFICRQRRASAFRIGKTSSLAPDVCAPVHSVRGSTISQSRDDARCSICGPTSIFDFPSDFDIACLVLSLGCLPLSLVTSQRSAQVSLPLEVRRSGVHGRGVYATQFIPEGTRIIEYTGQRVSWEDAPNDESNPHTFNFGLESGEVINPEIGGNEARWINHCCDPNCEAIEEDDRIFIDALRDIEPGQELFYDYAMEIDEPITKKLENELKCHGGAVRCRGTMLSL